MKPDARDDSPDEFADLHGQLDRLAQRLDGERFPGIAWPAAGARLGDHKPLRRPARGPWIFAGLTAAAAALILAVRPGLHTGGAGRLPDKPGTPEGKPAVADRRPAETVAARPELMPAPLLIVEDMDSYSIIDLSGDSPLVTFARKDSWEPSAPMCAALLAPSDTGPLPRAAPAPRGAPGDPITAPKRRRA